MDATVESIAARIRAIRLHRDGSLLAAFDGRSGAGKSTLAARLAPLLDGVVIEGDDFFSGGADEEWATRTPDERADRCIDWRRLRHEVLEPLLAGRSAAYRPFDFARGVGLADHAITREPKPVVLLDGVYSGRPELADLVDLAVLVEVRDDFARRQRLIAREGPAFMAAWHALWDPAEEHYFGVVSPPARFDLVASF